MKTIKKAAKKLQKTIKCIFNMFNQIYKCIKTTKAKIGKIWLMLFLIVCLTSCHATKASVRNDAEGSTTTITITTSNPTKTDVSPSVNLKGKE